MEFPGTLTPPPTPLEFPIPSKVGVWIFSGTTQKDIGDKLSMLTTKIVLWKAMILLVMNSLRKKGNYGYHSLKHKCLAPCATRTIIFQ